MAAKKTKVPIFRMTPNVQRIVESILFLVQEATKRKLSIDQYEIVKALFLADKAHFNKFGRPITYDNYTAMKHGPVPSLAYDLLKEHKGAIVRYSLRLPWKRREASSSKFYYEHAARAVDTDVLSKSDMLELADALTVVKSLGFSQIRRLTHEDPAYIDAWQDDGSAKGFPMSYALLLEQPNVELAKEISFASRHI